MQSNGSLIKKMLQMLLLIIIVVLGILFYNYIISTQKENRESLKFSENLYCFYLQDSFDNEGNLTLSDLINQEDSLNKLKKFNEKIHNTFRYIEVVWQPVEYVGNYKLTLEFVNGYLDSDKTVNLSNQDVSISGHNTLITPLNSLQLDYDAYNYYNLRVDDGRNFEKSDFKFSNITSIILGHNYYEFYKVGDNIEFYYLGRKTTGVIIGFLPENQKITNSECTSLDNYIIMPIISDIHKMQLSNTGYLYENEDFINENLTVTDLYMKILYTQKNNGIILCKEAKDFETVNNKIITISKQFGLVYHLKNCFVE